jgi:hypothetical protein
MSVAIDRMVSADAIYGRRRFILAVDGKWPDVSYTMDGCGKFVDRGWKEQME